MVALASAARHRALVTRPRLWAWPTSPPLAGISARSTGDRARDPIHSQVRWISAAVVSLIVAIAARRLGRGPRAEGVRWNQLRQILCCLRWDSAVSVDILLLIALAAVAVAVACVHSPPRCRASGGATDRGLPLSRNPEV